MLKSFAIAARLAITAAVLVVGSTTIAQAQCGNSNVQPSQSEVCDNGGDNASVAVGCCAAGCQAFVTVGTACRPDAGICDNGAEVCTGSTGTCPADSFATSTTACRASVSVCDAVESCNGTNGVCPADVVSGNTTLCRGSQGICDPSENCDGTNNACPADAKSNLLCRADSGACDLAGEFCDGTNNNCPASAAAPGGTLCRASLGQCDPQEVCNGTSSDCPANVTLTSLCREASAACDAGEFCDGTNGNCPADIISPNGAVCRASEGICDPQETCDGTNTDCPVDSKTFMLCRADSGVCDVGPEFCDGTNNDCPASQATGQGSLCRGAGGECDIAEVCDGTSSSCPADQKSSSVCRLSAGECDAQESCNGTSNSCPADAKSTQVCRPITNPICDVEESCDGTNDNCPDDELLNCVDNDEEECTEATCDENLGCILGDACIEICRGPGFWQTHSGYEKGENIGQEVLDEAGPFYVCGEIIANTTELGYLTSSLEGFCVRTQGVKQRQLYRFLLTTQFNCAISEGGSCDDITDPFMDVSFNECSALCAGDPVFEGPTLEQCKHELGCFNGGGRIIDGQCATGTCEGNPEQFCGGDFESCDVAAPTDEDDDDGDDDGCVPFADSCADVPLCSEDLDSAATICPKPGPASSPKTCRDARKNDCTIDDCPVDPDASCVGICGAGNQAPLGCYCDALACQIGDGCPDNDPVCVNCDD